MALRNILTKEDETLYKKCRPVTEFNSRLHQLLDDMADTLEKSNGVGLAAPQVGVLRRVSGSAVSVSVASGSTVAVTSGSVVVTTGVAVADPFVTVLVATGVVILSTFSHFA